MQLFRPCLFPFSFLFPLPLFLPTPTQPTPKPPNPVRVLAVSASCGRGGGFPSCPVFPHPPTPPTHPTLLCLLARGRQAATAARTVGARVHPIKTLCGSCASAFGIALFPQEAFADSLNNRLLDSLIFPSTHRHRISPPKPYMVFGMASFPKLYFQLRESSAC